MSPVRTCLWFSEGAAEAAAFYTSLVPDSAVTAPGPGVVAFHLGGTPYVAMDGAHEAFNTSSSIQIETADQAETDRLWDGLLQGGGEPGRCGWLTDRFGVSWQVVPSVLPRLLSDPDRVAADRALQAMLRMQRIDIAALEAAFAGE